MMIILLINAIILVKEWRYLVKCMFLAPHGFKSVTFEQNLLPESQNKSYFFVGYVRGSGWVHTNWIWLLVLRIISATPERRAVSERMQIACNALLHTFFEHFYCAQFLFINATERICKDTFLYKPTCGMTIQWGGPPIDFNALTLISLLLSIAFWIWLCLHPCPLAEINSHIFFCCIWHRWLTLLCSHCLCQESPTGVMEGGGASGGHQQWLIEGKS